MNKIEAGRKLRNAAGVTLVEAMIGLAVFAVGWAGVLGLVTTSFDSTARTWKSKNAYQLMDRQFWELFYRVKTQGAEMLNLADIPGTYDAGGVFPGQLLTNNRGVEMIVVGRSELEDLTATPPRVFIAAQSGSDVGMEFYPDAGGDSGGYLVRWERSALPTDFELGSKIEGNMLYSFNNEASGLTAATYDVKITVAWPYFESQPTISLTRKIERSFALGVY